MSFYEALVRPFLFSIDAEKSHNLTISLCESVGGLPFAEPLVRRLMKPVTDPLLRTTSAGLTLDSPIALGAGFDKNGRALSVLSNLGFGAIEIGAVSMQPCAGNAGCRAIRLVGEQAVLTRYGVPNEGVAVVAPRFARHVRRVPVGVNVIWNSTGKPDSSIHEVVADLAAAMAGFNGLVDYVTLNFACPNIRGESHFDSIDNVRLLFEAVGALHPHIPVFLKFRHRADLQWIDDLIALCTRYPWVRGFIPIAHAMRPMPAAAGGSAPLKGSISGAPLTRETIDIVRLWYSRIGLRPLALIATGGIMTARDVFAAMAAGASFVQIYTTMIYNGPGVVATLNRELAALMRSAHMASIAELIGSASVLEEEPLLESIA